MKKAAWFLVIVFFLGWFVPDLLKDFMTESVRESLSVGPLYWWMWKHHVYVYPIVAITLAVLMFFSEEIKGHSRLLLGKYYESGTPIMDTRAWDAVCHIMIHEKEIVKWHDESDFETSFYQAVKHLEHLAENMKNPVVTWGYFEGTRQRTQITPQMMIGHNLDVTPDGRSMIDKMVPKPGPMGMWNTEVVYRDIMFWRKQIDSRYPRLYFARQYREAYRILYYSLRWIVKTNQIQQRYAKGLRGSYCVYQPTESIVWDVCLQYLTGNLVELSKMDALELQTWLKVRVDEIGKEWGFIGSKSRTKIWTRPRIRAFSD